MPRLVRGLGVPTKNMRKAKMMIESDVLSGLMDSADLIHKSADTVSPTIPERSGDLRKSFFKEPVWEKDEVKVEFGYSMPYAAYVHEMGAGFLGKTINWTRKGSGAKFLDAAIKRNKRKITKFLGIKANVDNTNKYSKFDNFEQNFFS